MPRGSHRGRTGLRGRGIAHFRKQAGHRSQGGHDRNRTSCGRIAYRRRGGCRRGLSSRLREGRGGAGGGCGGAPASDQGVRHLPATEGAARGRHELFRWRQHPCGRCHRESGPFPRQLVGIDQIDPSGSVSVVAGRGQPARRLDTPFGEFSDRLSGDPRTAAWR